MTNNLETLTNLIDELDDDCDEVVPLDLNEIKSNIELYTSQKLCEMIICDRYFGCYKELAIICMEELARRRICGDNFDFETYIDKSLNDLPKLDFSSVNIGDVLRQSIGRKLNG